MTPWETVVRVAVWIAAVGGIVLPLLYGLGSPWWQNRAGRTLMTLSVAIGAVFVLVLTSYVLGNYPGQTALRVVVYSGLAVALWRLNVVVLLSQRADRQTRRERADDPKSD